MLFTARGLTGNLRLLIGMVRANQPWRLFLRLSRALTGAAAVGVFALVTTDLWALADAYGPLRLGLLGLAAIIAIGATLILGAHLWESKADPRAREQMVLFNIATALTVALGVATLYAALFVLSFLGALALVIPGLLEEATGENAGIDDYVEVAWLVTTLSTVGGALGAGLEADAAVRQAAYTYRADVYTSDVPDSPDEPHEDT